MTYFKGVDMRMNELINEIIQGDCLEVMKRIPNDYVDLTVTSPPYDNLRTYNEFDWDFEGIAEDLYRITKDGGVIVWVVGDATVNGSETGTSLRQALHSKEIGFMLHDTMIYKKSKIVPMDPNCNRYYQGFEYMFVLSKGKPNVCNYIKVPSKHAGKNAIAVNRNKDGSMRKDRIIKQKSHVVGNIKISSQHVCKNVIAVNRNKDVSMRKDRIIKEKGYVDGDFKIKSNI